MLLRLSSGDVFQLHETIACILEPARYPSAVEWSADVMSCVIRLVDAEKALFSLPTVTSPNIAWCGERTGEAVADYLAYYWQVDTALARRKQLGLEIHHRDDLYRPGELREDVLHNEWCVPNRLFDTLGMVVDVPGARFPALLHVYHEDSRRSFGRQGKGLIHLLLPAFKASVSAVRFFARYQEPLGNVIDSIADPLCLVGSRDEIIHANPAFSMLVANEAPNTALLDSIRSVTHAVRSATSTAELKSGNGSPGSPRQTARGKAGSYSISGTSIEGGSLKGAVVLIRMKRCSQVDLVSEQGTRLSRITSSLTTREAQVAACLAARLHAGEIAVRLGISVHTVRHHTENIFAKLGVRSRAAFRQLLQ